QKIGANDVVAIYGGFDSCSGVAFFTGRRLLILDGRYNNLEPGSYYPDAPHVFFTDAEFLSLWRSSQRVFLFLPGEKREEVDRHLPSQGAFLLAESGGKAAYSNRP